MRDINGIRNARYTSTVLHLAAVVFLIAYAQWSQVENESDKLLGPLAVYLTTALGALVVQAAKLVTSFNDAAVLIESLVRNNHDLICLRKEREGEGQRLFKLTKCVLKKKKLWALIVIALIGDLLVLYFVARGKLGKAISNPSIEEALPRGSLFAVVDGLMYNLSSKKPGIYRLSGAYEVSDERKYIGGMQKTWEL